MDIKTMNDLSVEILNLRRRISELEASEKELLLVREELKKSEEKYRMAFEYTGTAMMVFDADTTILMANHRIEQITGYTEDEVKGKSKWVDFVDEENRPKMLDYNRKRLEMDPSVPVEYEFKFRHKTGRLLDVLINVSVIPGANRILVSLVDITERKRIEKALAESERKYRDLFENANDIIYVHDSTGNFISANKAALTTVGYSMEELLKVNIRDIVDPAYLPLALKNIAEKIDKKVSLTPYELLITTKNKTPVWVEVSTRLIFDQGTMIGIQGIARDITDRKRNQEMLKETQERFKRVFEQSPIGIALCDGAGEIVEMNNSFMRMFGASEPGDRGRIDTNLFEAAEISPEKKQSLDDGSEVRHEAWFDISPDTAAPSRESAKRFFDWRITLFGNVKEGAKTYLAQVQDLTERKEAQEATISKAKEAAQKAEALVVGLRKELLHKATFHAVVSRSPAMNRIFDILPEVAQSSAAVLVLGESGTGKELIARTLHELSLRKSKPFIAINCGALPDQLLESELFGYKAGAFTDAKKDRPGKFALAEGGTLMLDEIGDVSPAMQVKLLRVLQEKTYDPLGGAVSVKANVRIIAATNRNLADMLKKGEFREDLFYRINVLSIELPPLRDRRCDIPLLCSHFIGSFNARYGKEIDAISPEALELLLAHDFPGNIRQLENIIEHAFIFCKETTIRPQHLPDEFRQMGAAKTGFSEIEEIGSYEDLEKMFLRKILKETGGNKTLAAQRLGMDKSTLFRKLKKFRLDDKEPGVQTIASAG